MILARLSVNLTNYTEQNPCSNHEVHVRVLFEHGSRKRLPICIHVCRCIVREIVSLRTPCLHTEAPNPKHAILVSLMVQLHTKLYDKPDNFEF